MKYEVNVRFNKDFIIVDEEKRKIIIGVRSKPVKGKANEEIIKKLAKNFGISSSNVLILAGLRSKKKIVEIIKE